MTDFTKNRSSGGETIGALLAKNASLHGKDIARREKERGIWKETTWAEYAEEVLACAAGLEKIGVTPGKAVLILGDNRRGCMAECWLFRCWVPMQCLPIPARRSKNSGTFLAKSKSSRPSPKIRNRLTRYWKYRTS